MEPVRQFPQPANLTEWEASHRRDGPGTVAVTAGLAQPQSSHLVMLTEVRLNHSPGHANPDIQPGLPLLPH